MIAVDGCSVFVITPASGGTAGHWSMRSNRVSTSRPAGFENRACSVSIGGRVVQCVRSGFIRGQRDLKTVREFSSRSQAHLQTWNGSHTGRVKVTQQAPVRDLILRPDVLGRFY